MSPGLLLLQMQLLQFIFKLHTQRNMLYIIYYIII